MRLFQRKGQNRQWNDDPNSDRKVSQLQNRFRRNQNPAVTRFVFQAECGLLCWTLRRLIRILLNGAGGALAACL